MNIGKFKIDTKCVNGTRDFPPSKFRALNWLFKKWRSVGESFGFSEYSTPILEPKNLYTTKNGCTFLHDQLYDFKDNEGTEVCIRPEMTPSLARLMMKMLGKVEEERGLLLPAKWFSIPQCWRFEEVVKGSRSREFYQWNVDVMGENLGMEYEVEIILMIITFLKSVGLTTEDIVIRISNRKILESYIESLELVGCDMDEVFEVIDQFWKIEEEEIRRKLKKLGIGDENVQKIIDLVSVKSIEGIKDLAKKNERMKNSIKEVEDLIDSLGAKYNRWVIFDPTIVRGLAYYTGLVFEAFEKKGKSALAGGGRYDTLLESFGYKKRKIQAIGFGLGDVCVMDILRRKRLLPKDLSKKKVDVLVIPASRLFFGRSNEVAMKYRENGKSVYVKFEKQGSGDVIESGETVVIPNSRRKMNQGNHETCRHVNRFDIAKR